MEVAEALKSLATQVKTDLDVVHEAGVAKGVKSEYDRFWDTYQTNGNRATYDYAFSYDGWTAETFKPKYDIVPKYMGYTFAYSAIRGDLNEMLSENGVILDTSLSERFQYAFAVNGLTHIPVISTVSDKNSLGLTMTFGRAQKLHTIDKLILKSDGSQIFNRAFEWCYALENIRFEGTIGNDINFQDCPLSGESVYDIVNHLMQLGMSDTAPPAGTYTLYLNEETWARATEYYKEHVLPNLEEDYGDLKSWIYDNYGWNCA